VEKTPLKGSLNLAIDKNILFSQSDTHLETRDFWDQNGLKSNSKEWCIFFNVKRVFLAMQQECCHVCEYVAALGNGNEKSLSSE
jgi:hypothetical protein